MKPLDEFYRHPRMADGHLNKCKACTRLDVKLHRAANPERVADIERRRNLKPGRRAKKSARQQRWIARHPERRKAHAAVQRAVRAGKLERPRHCPVCRREGMVHAHHSDYGKPLEVTWLCVRCHSEHHIDRDFASGEWR